MKFSSEGLVVLRRIGYWVLLFAVESAIGSEMLSKMQSCFRSLRQATRIIFEYTISFRDLPMIYLPS